MKRTKSAPAKSRASSAQEPVEKPACPPAATPSQAQRLAAAILEVLAGIRSPSAAAELLAISLPRYYQLETRALEGLVAALAPRPLGKQPSLENRVQQLEKELEAAHRACARQEALVRVTQRSLGLAASKTQPASSNGKGRKPRRPMVRALRAAQQLRARADAAGAGLPQESSLQPSAPTGGAEEPRP